MTLPELTLGIEEEYQIVQPDSRELTSYIQEFLEQGRLVLQDQIKAELMQSQVEVGSHICRNLQEARHELIRLRRSVCEVAERNGLRVVAASTHPFSTWSNQEVTEGERYIKLQDDMGEVARRLLIFGMHVHVGIRRPGVACIDVMNQARYFMPHLAGAVDQRRRSGTGRETGLKSYRSGRSSRIMPRSGLPPVVSSRGTDYAQPHRRLLIETTGCIDEPTKIWWDIRPHPKFPTHRVPHLVTSAPGSTRRCASLPSCRRSWPN